MTSNAWNVFEIINPLWPSDAIWQPRSGSTLAEVIACCLTAPSYYLQANADLSPNVFCGFHLRVISQGLMKLIQNIYLEITLLKSQPHHHWANELNTIMSYWYHLIWLTSSCLILNIHNMCMMCLDISTIKITAISTRHQWVKYLDDILFKRTYFCLYRPQ